MRPAARSSCRTLKGGNGADCEPSSGRRRRKKQSDQGTASQMHRAFSSRNFGRTSPTVQPESRAQAHHDAGPLSS